MSQACRDIEALIDQRRAGLADAQRLVLEQHLSECPSCARLSTEMHALAQIFDGAHTSLGTARRERAIAAAFANAQRAPSPMRRQKRALWIGSAVALAAAVAIAFVPVALRHEPGQAALENQDWFSATADTRYPYGHATVLAKAGSHLRFVARDHTLELDAGEVDVEVDPRPRLPFRVRTPRFDVDVLGTGFRVALDEVAVRHGRVRVFRRDGHVLAAELTAGQSWQLTSAFEAAPKTEARVETADAAPEQTRAQPHVAQARGLLLEARAALASGSVTEARSRVTDALTHRPRRIDRAEADTLRAECALVERDLATAQRLYLVVHTAYGDLPAGENALFAALKLAARRGEVAESQALARRYLTRYPRGRFVAEAGALAPARAPEHE